MKTSARNVFQGRIVALRQSGLLVEAILSTAGGLRVAALITDESYRSLALEEGKLVNASVKAPWVMIEAGAPEGGNGRVDATSGAENRFGRRGGTGAAKTGWSWKSWRPCPKAARSAPCKAKVRPQARRCAPETKSRCCSRPSP